MGDSAGGVEELTAIRERIGRDVDDSHDEGTLQGKAEATADKGVGLCSGGHFLFRRYGRVQSLHTMQAARLAT